VFILALNPFLFSSDPSRARSSRRAAPGLLDAPPRCGSRRRRRPPRPASVKRRIELGARGLACRQPPRESRAGPAVGVALPRARKAARAGTCLGNHPRRPTL